MIGEGWPRRRTGSSRLVIVDDHDLARAGLRAILQGQRGIEIVGEVSGGQEAIALCRRLRPDLVLMDVRMPDMDGLTATRAIKHECPNTSVIIVTMYENPDYVLEAIKAGAAGYLLKDATQREVLSAIRRVLQGESLLDPKQAAALLRRLIEEAQGSNTRDPSVRLSPREMEVLHLVAMGLTNREIAERLMVSVGTVKVHVERIIGKLGVADRTQAAVRAVQWGLITAVSSESS